MQCLQWWEGLWGMNQLCNSIVSLGADIWELAILLNCKLFVFMEKLYV